MKLPIFWTNYKMDRYLSVLEDVAVCADLKVLMKVDINISVIVADPQGILDRQLRHPILHLLVH